MLSSRRSRYLVRPRQTAIYLTKILTSKSLPEIGREFSNRDHTTIIHSVKTIEKLKENDAELSINIDNLKNKILYNKKMKFNVNQQDLTKIIELLSRCNRKKKYFTNFIKCTFRCQQFKTYYYCNRS